MIIRNTPHKLQGLIQAFKRSFNCICRCNQRKVNNLNVKEKKRKIIQEIWLVHLSVHQKVPGLVLQLGRIFSDQLALGLKISTQSLKISTWGSFRKTKAVRMGDLVAQKHQCTNTTHAYRMQMLQIKQISDKTSKNGFAAFQKNNCQLSFEQLWLSISLHTIYNDSHLSFLYFSELSCFY